MIAWMLYAVMVAAALALAGYALERALTLYHRPSRFVWVGAISGGVLLPLLVRMGLLQRGGDTTLGSLDVVATLPAALSIPSSAVTRAGPATASLDTVILVLWGIASAVILGWIAWSLFRLSRERAAWSEAHIDGVRVLVSHDVGPAVVGVTPSLVVVPRWLIEADPSIRRLALEHEAEHVRAGDTRLLLFGLVVVALVPWNPVLWWQLKRLRAAVEFDCDRRVVGGKAAPRVYAHVLLKVGERASRVALPSPALTEPRSLLSRRIKAMLSRKVRMRLLRAVAYGVATLGLVVAACDAPAPELPSDIPDTEVDAAAQLAMADALPEHQVDEPPERISCPAMQYPLVLREQGIEGGVLLQFVVDASGRVPPASIEVVQSEHEAFATASKSLIAGCLFRAGRLAGEPVPVRVQMPINFSLAHEMPEDSVRVRVRLSGDSPVLPPGHLYVVDGVVIADRSNIDVDALDIETIEVIRGEVARAMYGERAKNGVILITTKN